MLDTRLCGCLDYNEICGEGIVLILTVLNYPRPFYLFSKNILSPYWIPDPASDSNEVPVDKPSVYLEQG
jgi:hypothetical protein